MKRLVTGIVAVGTLAGANSIPTSLVHATSRARSAVASGQQSTAQAPSSDDIVATAKRYIGAPYATIGNTPDGFSCIGFVNFVFAQNGVNVPFDIPLAWNSNAPHVDSVANLLPGDVLFYSNTVFAGLSHAAIYIGNGQMIGADNFAVGVHVDTMSDQYWASRYTGATRPIASSAASVAATPKPDAATPAPTSTPAPTAAPLVATAAPGSQLRPLSATIGIFSGPGYQYTQMTTLAPTTLLTVLRSQDGWYDVQFSDPRLGPTVGFVNAADVSPIGGQSTGQPLSAATATPESSTKPAAAISSNNGLVVVKGPLNVRSGPSKSFQSVGALPTGTHVLAIEQQPGWTKVLGPKGLIGWVANQYVALRNGAPSYSNANTTTTSQGGHLARVTASVLNIRTAPDAHARIMTVLFAGERVHLLLRRGAWDEVQLRSGASGWANAKWLANA